MNSRPVKLSPSEAPKLRLVVDSNTGPPATLDERRVFTRAVARENHQARGLSVDDVRDVFAARVVGALDGGRAAILRPQVRRNLVAAAVAMGIRPFEANLVIALVQDSTRRGETSSTAQARAHLVEVSPVRRTRNYSVLVTVGVTLALAIGVLAALVAWTLSLD